MPVDDRTPLRTARDAADRLGPRLAARRHEALLVAYLDAERRLLDILECDGGIAALELPARAILTRALGLGASGFILAHNHPSGDPMPSEADIAATRGLAEAAAQFGVALHDHLIFAGGERRSLRALGLI